MADEIRTAQGVWDTYYHPGAAVTGLAAIIPAWLQGIGAVALLASFQWWLALLVLAGRFMTWHRLQQVYHEATKMAVGQSDVLRRAEYYRDLALTADAAKEVRLWGLLPWLLDRLDSEWRQAMDRVWHERGRNQTTVTLTLLGMAAVELVALLVIGWAGVQGSIGLGAVPSSLDQCWRVRRWKGHPIVFLRWCRVRRRSQHSGPSKNVLPRPVS